MREQAGGRRLTLMALVCLPLLGGCAALPKFEAPKLSVVSLKMQGGDIFSQRVLVRMRVFNPNDARTADQGHHLPHRGE